jgi:hypothetical protein
LIIPVFLEVNSTMVDIKIGIFLMFSRNLKKCYGEYQTV